MRLGVIASSRLKYCAEFIAYDNAVESAGGELNGAQQYWLNEFIVGLKNAGLWNDLICFYPFLSAESQTLSSEITHSINMRNPGTYNLSYLPGSNISKHTSIAFTSSTTGTPTASGQVANTGIVPSTAWSANNVSWGAHIRTGANIGPIFGVRNSANTGTTPTFSINNVSNLGSPYASAYTYSSSNGFVAGTGGTGIGSMYAVRRSSSDFSIYENAVLKGIKTGTTGQGTRPIYPVYIGGYNNGSAGTYTYFGVKSIGNVWIASRGFTAGELTTFYTLEASLNTKVGR